MIIETRNDKAWAEQHIEKFGHASIFSRHECPLCGLDWTCRKQYCKRPQDSHCKACETATLLEEIQRHGKDLHRFLFDPCTADAQTPYDLQRQNKERARLCGLVDGLVENARIVSEME